MTPPTSTSDAKSSSKSELEAFLRRTNNAGLHAVESSNADKGNWNVVDQKAFEHEQDETEWVFVGKTEAEKRMAERARRIEKH